MLSSISIAIIRVIFYDFLILSSFYSIHLSLIISIAFFFQSIISSFQFTVSLTHIFIAFVCTFLIIIPLLFFSSFTRTALSFLKAFFQNSFILILIFLFWQCPLLLALIGNIDESGLTLNLTF